MYSKYQYSVFLIASLLSAVTLAQSNVINNGASITIDSGANVIIANSVTTNAGGSFDNAGNLLVGGDFTNNSGGDAFTADTGSVELNGDNNQTIGGTDSSRFNVLSLSGTGDKLLAIDAQIADTLNLNTNSLLLQSNTLSILSANSAAITNTTGSIISESTDATGIISRSIDTSTGVFSFPFATAAGTPIPVVANITTAGTGTGTINLATYPTAADNLPLPPGALNLDVLDAVNNDADVVVNRFWVADNAGFGTPPTYTIGLSPDAANDFAFSAGQLDGNQAAVQFIGGDWSDGNGGSVSAGNSANAVISTAGLTPLVITGINDEPGFDLTENTLFVGGSTDTQTIPGFAANIDLGALDDIEQLANFIVEVDDPSLFAVPPSISSDGTLDFVANGNAAGNEPATVTVTLNDGGGNEFGGVDNSIPQTFFILFDVVEVPTLSPFGLAILLLLLAISTLFIQRRQLNNL